MSVSNLNVSKKSPFKICTRLVLGGQQVAVRPAQCQQVFQLPNSIQTVAVQIPVSQNGQTVLQTIQVASTFPNETKKIYFR